MDSSLLAFLPVAAVLIAVPGPDVLLVVRNTALGRRAGVATAVGTLSGLLVHGVAAAVGLSALIAASGTAFTVVKLVGAGYLVFLGVHALWSSRPRRTEADGGSHRVALPGIPPLRGTVGEASFRRSWRQGFLTNVLNPKVGVFFLALLPQFVPAGAPAAASIVFLATVFVAMTALYLLLLVVLTARVATLLQRPRVRRWLDRVAGIVMIGFGIRLATSTR